MSHSLSYSALRNFAVQRKGRLQRTRVLDCACASGAGVVQGKELECNPREWKLRSKKIKVLATVLPEITTQK